MSTHSPTSAGRVCNLRSTPSCNYIPYIGILFCSRNGDGHSRAAMSFLSGTLEIEKSDARSPNNPEQLTTKRIVALQGDVVHPLPPSPPGPVRIPPGHVWVEGDSRFRSRDSNTYGPVSGRQESRLLTPDSTITHRCAGVTYRLAAEALHGCAAWAWKVCWTGEASWTGQREHCAGIVGRIGRR